MEELIDEMQILFARYLMEEHGDTLHTSEQLIEAQENGLYVDDFCKWVRDNV